MRYLLRISENWSNFEGTGFPKEGFKDQEYPILWELVQAVEAVVKPCKKLLASAEVITLIKITL